MQFLLLLFLLAILLPSALAEIKVVLLNNFTVRYAGYTSVVPTQSPTSISWRLYISSFSSLPQSADPVYMVDNIQTKLTAKISPTQITDKVSYPNDIIPADTLIPSSVIIPSGFVMPSKADGNIYLIPSTNDPRPLVPRFENKSWFYHDVAFKDMDKDGLIDVVTAGANILLPGGPTSELVWLKNPGGDLTMTEPWQVHSMNADNGPDLDVRFGNVDSTEVLFANGYFSRTLKMFWSDSNDLWNDSSRLRMRDVDSERHRFFSVRLIMDLNGDQRPDLLVTNNDVSNGSLLAYELPPPGELFTGVFKKHVLASGFKPLATVQVGGAPGHAEAFRISSNDRKKPIILLSGDDDGCVYLLEAVRDSDPSDWQYTITKLYDSGGSIVGQLSIEDVDQDGNPELFVPVYDRDTVLIYRLIDQINSARLSLISYSLITVSIILLCFINFEQLI